MVETICLLHLHNTQETRYKSLQLMHQHTIQWLNHTESHPAKWAWDIKNAVWCWEDIGGSTDREWSTCLNIDSPLNYVKAMIQFCSVKEHFPNPGSMQPHVLQMQLRRLQHKAVFSGKCHTTTVTNIVTLSVWLFPTNMSFVTAFQSAHYKSEGYVWLTQIKHLLTQQADDSVFHRYTL